MNRSIFAIVKWFALFYLLIFIPSFAIEESRFMLGPDVVHVYDDIPNSIYANTPQYAVYGVNKLGNYPDQIFLLGGSAAGHAFKPKRLMKELAGYKVHNLCLAGANATEMKEMVDLIESRVDLLKAHSVIFVLNSHFASFLDNQRAYNSAFTSIEDEKLRHHLYKLSEGHVVPALPEPLMSVAVVFVRPFIWLYTLKFNISDTLEYIREKFVILSQQDEPNGHSSDPRSYIDYRMMQFQNRGFAEKQFNEFDDLIKTLVKLKATIVLVDLPVPSYFRKGFVIYDDYRRRMSVIAKEPAVHYLDLTSWAPDDQFLDDAHCKPEFYDGWSAELARYLKTVARLNGPETHH